MVLCATAASPHAVRKCNGTSVIDVGILLRGGTEARHWGTCLELERPRKIVLTWITDESEESDPSKVFLTIEPDGQGCKSTNVHEMAAKWSEYVALTGNGWSRMMQTIEVVPTN